MKLLSIFIAILSIVLILIAYMSHAANRKTERQKYQILKEENGFEIRFYPKALMATVVSKPENNESDRSQNFRRLAGYIFGGNKSNQKIDMTAPVHMEKDGNANKMSFVLPAQYQMNDLPKPNDTSLAFHYSDEGYYAALRFGGFAGDDKIEQKKQELGALLVKSGYEVIGNYTYLGYNAPWDVVNRENDIIVKIKIHN